MESKAHATEALRCRISGRVQGVFFRASTQHKAKSLGLAGYARNRSDGGVEVLAVGPPEALQALRDWLQTGPPQAAVTAVDCEPVSIPDPPPQHFDTR